jgi:hypothetical protein
MHYISDEIDSLPILYKFFVDDDVSVATHGCFASNVVILEQNIWMETYFKWIESVFATATDYTSNNIISRDTVKATHLSTDRDRCA